MINCFSVKETKNAIPVTIVARNHFADWQKQQDNRTQQWLAATQFRGDAGNLSLISDTDGKLIRVVYCVSELNQIWSVGSLPFSLPEGEYFLEVDEKYYSSLALGWGLGAYQFTRYKKATRHPAKLILSKQCDAKYLNNVVQSIYLVRDLINTPTDDMGPSELAEAAIQLGKKYQATVSQIIGENLLKENYACIYTVGRASDDAPRLIDLRWGDAKHPKIVLVGKGVCFDSGGLDIKNAAGMLLMKKDMGGAAHVLGLAQMIMEAQLPVNLRVLIPAVENVISGNAYRPGDIIKSRKGLTIEISNTDAEGRLVLADALTEGASDHPNLLIDMSTLTGAARIALGTDLPAMFSNNDELAQQLSQLGDTLSDPMWRMPLFAPYRESLNSPIADINNSPSDSYAGAITAALFLKEFVPDHIPWVHFDMMAWNLKNRPGRPVGGEAMSLRAVFNYLMFKFPLS